MSPRTTTETTMTTEIEIREFIEANEDALMDHAKEQLTTKAEPGRSTSVFTHSDVVRQSRFLAKKLLEGRTIEEASAELRRMRKQ